MRFLCSNFLIPFLFAFLLLSPANATQEFEQFIQARSKQALIVSFGALDQQSISVILPGTSQEARRPLRKNFNLAGLSVSAFRSFDPKTILSDLRQPGTVLVIQGKDLANPALAGVRTSGHRFLVFDERSSVERTALSRKDGTHLTQNGAPRIIGDSAKIILITVGDPRRGLNTLFHPQDTPQSKAQEILRRFGISARSFEPFGTGTMSKLADPSTALLLADTVFANPANDRLLTSTRGVSVFTLDSKIELADVTPSEMSIEPHLSSRAPEKQDAVPKVRVTANDHYKEFSRRDSREIQTLLNQLEFKAGSVDGVLGAGSRRAIGQFQASLGDEATGFLTETQHSKLRALAKQKMQSQPASASQQVANDPVGNPSPQKGLGWLTNLGFNSAGCATTRKEFRFGESYREIECFLDRRPEYRGVDDAPVFTETLEGNIHREVKKHPLRAALLRDAEGVSLGPMPKFSSLQKTFLGMLMLDCPVRVDDYRREQAGLPPRIAISPDTKKKPLDGPRICAAEKMPRKPPRPTKQWRAAVDAFLVQVFDYRIAQAPPPIDRTTFNIKSDGAWALTRNFAGFLLQLDWPGSANGEQIVVGCEAGGKHFISMSFLTKRIRRNHNEIDIVRPGAVFSIDLDYDTRTELKNTFENAVSTDAFIDEDGLVVVEYRPFNAQDKAALASAINDIFSGHRQFKIRLRSAQDVFVNTFATHLTRTGGIRSDRPTVQQAYELCELS